MIIDKDRVSTQEAPFSIVPTVFVLILAPESPPVFSE